MKKESKSTAFNFEIEHAVDYPKENVDVDADLKKVIDEPGYEETKLVKDAIPQPAKSAELECFGTRCKTFPRMWMSMMSDLQKMIQKLQWTNPMILLQE